MRDTPKNNFDYTTETTGFSKEDASALGNHGSWCTLRTRVGFVALQLDSLRDYNWDSSPSAGSGDEAAEFPPMYVKK